MHIIKHGIRGMNDCHLASIFKTFWLYVYDARVGRITVTIRPEDVPEDGVVSSLIVSSPVRNAELTLQEDVIVLIVHRNHRIKTIVDLRNDNHPMFALSRNPLSVYLILLSDRRALSNMGTVNNSNLLSTVSSTVLPCTEFLPILRSVVSYERAFSEEYQVPFQKAGILGIDKDLKSAHFIPSACTSTNNRYMSVSCFCLDKEDLIPLFEDLKKRDQLTGNKTQS